MVDVTITPGDFITEKQSSLKDIYRIGAKIGEGIFGSIHLLTNRQTHEVRVVKVIRKSKLKAMHEREMFMNEVAILKSIDHPNVVKLYEQFQDDKCYYLVMEYCSGGELFTRISTEGSISESQAAEYIRQVLSVVAYCHARGIVHRDLKLENFLLSTEGPDAILKVIDFGTARFFTRGQPMMERYGTPYYIAPEVAVQTPRYFEKCDVWSVGVNLYILLCGYAPFEGKDDDSIIRKILLGRFTFPDEEWSGISDEAKDLISQMLRLDPEQRISAHDALSHPWLRTVSRTLLTASAPNLLKNLKNFQAGVKLREAALSFITTQLVSKEEQEEMLQTFMSLDTDSSGTLSREEIINGFMALNKNGLASAEHDADRIMRQVDIDGSGDISYSEFVLATINLEQLLSTERIEAAFNAFDHDGNGYISKEELKKVFGLRRGRSIESELEAVVVESDTNGDGRIDKAEFVRMMTRKPRR